MITSSRRIEEGQVLPFTTRRNESEGVNGIGYLERFCVYLQTQSCGIKPFDVVLPYQGALTRFLQNYAQITTRKVNEQYVG